MVGRFRRGKMGSCMRLSRTPHKVDVLLKLYTCLEKSGDAAAVLSGREGREPPPLRLMTPRMWCSQGGSFSEEEEGFREEVPSRHLTGRI
mmetsp:Transcript_10236/g.31272  ORF Transcript_10236/g.31272 Transcript_10236/m.31272 type:complete len:90 (-) Transcript_10236:1435-1704(-)